MRTHDRRRWGREGIVAPDVVHHGSEIRLSVSFENGRTPGACSRRARLGLVPCRPIRRRRARDLARLDPKSSLDLRDSLGVAAQREESTRDLPRKAFLGVVGVADGQALHGLL